MAIVDPDDDTVLRHVVRHYRYDPDRHERRHVSVAAYSTEPEFDREMDRRAADLAQRRRDDPDTDPQEHISGVSLEPGYRTLQANGRLLQQMMLHGAYDPAVVAELDLPSNVGVLTVGHDDTAQ